MACKLVEHSDCIFSVDALTFALHAIKILFRTHYLSTIFKKSFPALVRTLQYVTHLESTEEYEFMVNSIEISFVTHYTMNKEVIRIKSLPKYLLIQLPYGYA
jgi:hypothetical protein